MKKIFWILFIACLGFVQETDAQETMQRRRWLEEGIAALGETNLVQPINETQEIDGVSFELIQAYADTHIMIFWYAIRGLELPEGQMYGRLLTPVLSNTDGSWHPNSGAYHIDPEREDSTIYGGAFEFGYVSDYPTDGVYEQQLTVTIGDVWQSLYIVPEDYIVDEKPIPEEYQYEIPTYGEYVFDLSLNVTPERVIEVGETIESNGISLTLERVHLLPFLVTVDICHEIPSEDDWFADAQVFPDNGDAMLLTGGEYLAYKPEQHCSSIQYLDTLPLDTERLRIEVPHLQTSVPEIISPELAARAEAELAELGIIVDYAEDSSFNYDVIEIPEAYGNEVGLLIYDALRERYEGNWVFEVELPENLFGED